MKIVIDISNIIIPVLYIISFAFYFYDFTKAKKKFINLKRFSLCLNIIISFDLFVVKNF